jgi:hypothetical protein
VKVVSLKRTEQPIISIQESVMSKKTNRKPMETRPIVILTAKERREVDAAVLGSWGHAPAKERPPLPSTVRATLGYALAR